MMAQVKSGAGIHMSTFKETTAASDNVTDHGDSPDPADLDISAWTAPPGFMAEMRAAELKGGV